MRIYLDHNATTPPDPRVIAAMAQAAGQTWGNPSSLHTEGRAARDAIERARKQVLALLEPASSSPSSPSSPSGPAGQLVFTSGGTEANNTAIAGLARASVPGAPLITSPLEHPSVLAAATRRGAVTYLPVDEQGRWSLGDLDRALASAAEGAVVSLQLANHEIGNLYPVAEAARLCRSRGALLHCDAVQAAGRVPLDVVELGVDALTLSAHKLRGPRGVGALWVRASLSGCLSALCVGGGQERGLRAGTENLPAIVGFGVACALITEAGADHLAARAAATTALRDRLEARLLAIPGARRHGDGAPGARTPGTCNVAFEGVEGDVLLMALDLRGAAVSTGAACSSGSPEPSPVIRALGVAAGLSPEAARSRAREALRISLGAETTQAEVDQVATWLEEIVAHVRTL